MKIEYFLVHLKIDNNKVLLRPWWFIGSNCPDLQMLKQQNYVV